MHPADLLMLMDYQYRLTVFSRWSVEHRQIVDALVLSSEQAVAFGTDAETNWLSRQAVRIASCCISPMIYSAGVDDRLIVNESRCKSRLCPRCAALRRKELTTQLTSYVNRMADPRRLNLTLCSTREPLRDQLIRLRRCFASLRKSPGWKAHVVGGLYTIEVTWNPETHLWHPHLHAIIDGCQWTQYLIASLWLSITGDSNIVDIRDCTSRKKAVRYITSYIAKSSDVTQFPAHAIAEWAMAVQSLRFVARFGSLHGVSLPVEESGIDFAAYKCIGSAESLAVAASRGDSAAAAFLQALRNRGRKPAAPDFSSLSADVDPAVFPLEPNLQAWFRSEAERRRNKDHDRGPPPGRGRFRDHTIPLWDDGIPHARYACEHGR